MAQNLTLPTGASATPFRTEPPATRAADVAALDVLFGKATGLSLCFSPASLGENQAFPVILTRPVNHGPAPPSFQVNEPIDHAVLTDGRDKQAFSGLKYPRAEGAKHPHEVP